jgi:hypothetical protein
MRYTLIQLHRNGVVLTKDELAEAPRHTGNLVVEDWPEGSSFGRHIRQARLKRPPLEGDNDIIPPLFDPVLVKMDDTRMTLHGYQIHYEAGVTVHYAQYWVLRAAD